MQKPITTMPKEPIFPAYRYCANGHEGIKYRNGSRCPLCESHSKIVQLEDKIKDFPPESDYYFQPEKVKSYRLALADFLCWIEGFKSGGGSYYPDSQNTLRDLANCLDLMIQHQKQNQ